MTATKTAGQQLGRTGWYLVGKPAAAPAITASDPSSTATPSSTPTPST